MPADEWNFPGRAVHPHVGHVIEPGPGLGVQVPKTAEGETLEEVASDVAHGALDLAFGFWASRTMDAGLKAVVLRKVEEFRVPLHLTVLPAADGHGLHVVVEDALRHALEVVKRIHVAALQNGFVRFPHKLDVQHPGPAQHHGETPQVPLDAEHLDAAKVAPIDLGFLTGFRFVANGELSLALRPQRFHEVFQDGIAAFVTKAPNLAENDLSIGDFVLQDALQDVLFVGVELGRPLGLRGPLITPRRALLEQTRHGLAVNPQLPGDGRFRKAFGEQLSNLQHILTSVHPVSSSWPSLETAFFRGGDFSFRR